jgi:predicted pyridoxine 5'-phosphate oxidase superfamily flavin-nucleotide-binding protein
VLATALAWTISVRLDQHSIVARARQAARRSSGPNVSPKEIFAAYDDHRLVIANIASPGSVRNLRANERVCVSFVEIFVQKGYKVRGRARLVAPADDGFDELAAPLQRMTQRPAPLQRMTQRRYPIHHVIAVDADSVERIRAPSYQLDPNTTEAEQIEGAMAAYEVRLRR